MYLLEGVEQEQAKKYMERAAEVARLATCERSSCGSVIVKDGKIIGEGFNSPPKGMERQRRCGQNKTAYHQKVTDKTCCIHAEERAMVDALRQHPNQLEKSKLYFIRLDEEGNRQFSGQPYCTLCSKLALEVGITEFLLWHQEGIMSYTTPEYNDLSFAYGKAEEE